MEKARIKDIVDHWVMPTEESGYMGGIENKPVLALRWNGKAGNPIGSPQSRGLPTWFIVPDQFASALIGTLPPDMQTLARNFIPR